MGLTFSVNNQMADVLRGIKANRLADWSYAEQELARLSSAVRRHPPVSRREAALKGE